MTLVQEGRIALSDPVDRWLPELAEMRVLAEPTGPLDCTVPARRPITIEDLMTHRSGLAYAFSVTGPIGRAYAVIAAPGRRPLAGRGGGAAAGSPARRAADLQPRHRGSRHRGVPDRGQALHTVLDERILAPLGMADSGFFISGDKRDRAATMYRLDARENASRCDGSDPGQGAAVLPGRASLVSTADDYLRFARMLLGGGEVDGVRVLSEESVRLMRTDRLTEGAETPAVPGRAVLGGPRVRAEPFGGHRPVEISAVVRAGRSGHVQLAWAYGTWWQADPANDLILIYLIQNYPDLSSAAAAVAGNTSLARLQSVQPKFVRRTYAALGI